jgi:hypothetical protein
MPKRIRVKISMWFSIHCVVHKKLVLLNGVLKYRGYKLASGTQDGGFAPGRSRRIFQAKKSSACLPSEGK